MGSYILVAVLVVVMFIIGLLTGQKIGALRKEATIKEWEKIFTKTQTQLEHSEAQRQEELKKHKTQMQGLEDQHVQRLEQVKRDRENFRKDKNLLEVKLTRRNTEFLNLQQKTEEQKKDLSNLQNKFQKEFENLANKILDQKSEKFTKLNKSNIEHILSPLQEKIKGFEEKVERSRDDALKRHAQLGQQLKQLNEQNIKISEEANNLTKALKGESKTQGDWGEKILSRVLEKSGLQKGREYFEQPVYKDKNGRRLYPDVIIHLPDNKRMVIDSKVSLTAYEKYANEEDKKLKQTHLKQHISSLKKHIKELSEKKYEDLHKMESPDFVLMFVPLEPALFIAQEKDTSFFYTAFQKNILLVSPTTLLATLRTVDALWSNEKQQRNALKIAQHAASLYHKFQNLLNDLETVGNRIESTQNAYHKTMKKLTGQQNLIKDIDKLQKLGVSPKKKIDKTWLDKAK